MAEQSPNELIQKYLDATISAEEFQTLEKLITSDPVVADAFARAGRLDSALSAYFVEAESIDASAAVARNAVEEIRAADDYLPPKPQRRGWQVGSIAIAACLLIAAGVGVWFALPRQQQVPTKELAQNVHQLLSGRARVDGKENQPPRDGSRVETFDETVLIAMADG
ncbi:MAG: hypothetical protein K8T89_16805, partial [Planctomycetes bacterium]|nr:hypothetical protein [Planctomycetota bacterium]